jgi:hypothetical protein
MTDRHIADKYVQVLTVAGASHEVIHQAGTGEYAGSSAGSAFYVIRA